MYRNANNYFSLQLENMAYADYDYDLPQDEDAEDYLDYYEEVSHSFVGGAKTLR